MLERNRLGALFLTPLPLKIRLIKLIKITGKNTVTLFFIAYQDAIRLNVLSPSPQDGYHKDILGDSTGLTKTYKSSLI